MGSGPNTACPRVSHSHRLCKDWIWVVVIGRGFVRGRMLRRTRSRCCERQPLGSFGVWVKRCNPPSDTFRVCPGQSVLDASVGALLHLR